MIIGVTGSIGSGKSTVCEYLRTLGFYVLDADRISRELMMKNQEGYIQTIALFGESIVQKNGEIDRGALANHIFQNKNAKNDLEKILHPLILMKLQNLTDEYIKENNCLVFWEVPLLFETNYHIYCDKSVCVIADEKQLIDRVKRRSNLSEEEVHQRLKAQMSVEEKQKLADYVIYNHGSLISLYEQVDQLIQLLNDNQIMKL